jgi:hypothetical protein
LKVKKAFQIERRCGFIPFPIKKTPASIDLGRSFSEINVFLGKA